MEEVTMSEYKKQPAVFVDLDGTVRASKSDPDGFIQGADDIVLLPNTEEVLLLWLSRGYLILGVSNQGGVAFGYSTVEQIEAEMEATRALFKKDPFDRMLWCVSHPESNHPVHGHRSLFRKPDIGMLALHEKEAMRHNGVIIDYSRSVFVGDRWEDEECARRAGIEFIHASKFFNRDQTGA
jgi:D-glycero-D-manno-heptose 1,7-bisphosphate phosphatase